MSLHVIARLNPAGAFTNSNLGTNFSYTKTRPFIRKEGKLENFENPLHKINSCEVK